MTFVRNNWVRALVINIVIIVLVLLFTDMSYETNDDYAIAGRIVSGDPYVFYIDYHLCLLLIKLQQLLPALNAVVLTEVFLAFASFVMITKVILDSQSNIFMRIVLVMTVAMYSFDQYSIIQFTKASAVMVIAGSLVLVDSVVKRRPFPYYIIGMVLLYLGAAIRIKNITVAIGFVGLFLIFWLIENRKNLIEDGFVRPKALVSYGLIAVFIAGAIGVNMWSDSINNSTYELKDYHNYNSERSTVIDYSEFDRYSENKDKFDQIGLSQNDLYLINNWYFDYDGAASEDNLRKTNMIYAQSRTGGKTAIIKAVKKCAKHIISSVKDRKRTGAHIAILVLTAMLGMMVLRFRYWPYVFAVGIATAGLYATLFYMGRPAYRAMYVMDLGAMVWLLYYYSDARSRIDDEKREEKSQKALKVFVALCSVVVIAGLAAGSYVSYEKCRSSYDESKGRIRSAEMTERISSDKEHIYVFSTREKKNPSTYMNPLKAPDADKNVFTFGGWGTKSPYLMDRLKSAGLNNVFGDIIDNDKVYVVENRNVERMEEYFNKWYAIPEKKIKYKDAGTVDGIRLWQVVSEAEEIKVPSDKKDMPLVAVADTSEDGLRWLIRRCEQVGMNAVHVIPEEANADKYDALIIPGGGCVTPSLYGQEKDSRTYDCDIEKDRAQMEVVREFAEAGKPIMGICRGAQLINVTFGGTLNQYIEGHNGGVSNDTSITEDCLIYPEFGDEMTIECYHQQCVKDLAEGFKITQTSNDAGYAELFQHETLPIYAIQYHPESMWKDGRKILRLFKDEVHKHMEEH